MVAERFLNFLTSPNAVSEMYFLYFSIEVNSANSLITDFFLADNPARSFSIRIVPFGWLELDLPTPVSHPPSQECDSAAALHTAPKNTFASIKNKHNSMKSLFYN